MGIIDHTYIICETLKIYQNEEFHQPTPHKQNQNL